MALHLSVSRHQELAASLVLHPVSSLPRLRLLSPHSHTCCPSSLPPSLLLSFLCTGMPGGPGPRGPPGMMPYGPMVGPGGPGRLGPGRGPRGPPGLMMPGGPMGPPPGMGPGPRGGRGRGRGPRGGPPGIEGADMDGGRGRGFDSGRGGGRGRGRGRVGGRGEGAQPPPPPPAAGGAAPAAAGGAPAAEPVQLSLPAMLANATPEQQKQILGERLFPLVQAQQPELAGKITGMLLEMDNSEVLLLLDNQEALDAKVGGLCDQVGCVLLPRMV